MPIADKKQLDSALHGNVKFHFHKLKKIGDYFILDEPEQRYSISSSLKNFNKKNKTAIVVTTRKTPGGVIVQRTL